MDDSDNIYVTNYVNGHTWHNGNAQGNRKALAILVDGNFDVEKPTEKQLLKLKQILDHIYGNWFSKNGWFPFEVHMNTRDRVRHKYTEGKTVRTTHYHNEVAQRGYSTACCGKNLIPKVVEYRNKAGKVNWGNPQKDTMEDKTQAKNKIIEQQQDEINAKTKLLLGQRDEIEGLQEEIQSLKETVKKKEESLVDENTRVVDLLNRNSELLRRVAELETELDLQKVEPAESRFELTWENLPTWVKYIAPNMLAVFIPGLITLIADLDIQEPEVLASLGISVATIKSLIIGYLKKIQKG
jgi:hypothetical protein